MSTKDLNAITNHIIELNTELITSNIDYELLVGPAKYNVASYLSRKEKRELLVYVLKCLEQKRQKMMEKIDEGNDG